MSKDHEDLILELAAQAHAVLQCSECRKHYTRLFVTGAVESAQTLALEPWKQGKFDGLSWPQVADLVRTTIEAAPLAGPVTGGVRRLSAASVRPLPPQTRR